ncbi:NAD(P)H-dependent oxidoreductase [Streptococcus saliviloxodontae]|uniref:NADPH-quinone reductase n=1 Tax=Streptococcus saliviloxodontae TaxID=1349416 RepID=A0ABS2PN91_9STRE|nr:NAD(P)H-dependent oxidoreductase [Streptococcus saliviloxodontae]MBM7636824.1 putative NADPH-quinone reductase [Streptococcus saliviloxodontae]
MTTRIFVFHPNLKGQSRANQVLADAAAQAGFDVRDMYSLYPDFAIDVKTEQSILEQTDRIVLQFPMYWYSSPALLKQWEDMVLEYGWAYGSTGTALQGKEVILAITQGAGAEDYRSDGRFQVTTKELLKPFETIRFHTGLVFKEAFVLAGTLSLSEEDLQEASKAYLTHISR